VRLVAENSEAEIARKEGLASVRAALRELTANLLRIMRGAGRPYNVVGQLGALVDALVRFEEKTESALLPNEIADFLSIERDQQFRDSISDAGLDRIDAEQLVLRGAIQIAASRLLSQRTQESIGHHEMYDGIIEIGRINRMQRAARQGSTATTPSGSSASRKKRRNT
jgi:hypothetical protein